MIFKQLYDIKMNLYKETGIRFKPEALLTLLLLSDIEKYKIPLTYNGIDFFETFKDDIENKFAKMEEDFGFTFADYLEIVKNKEFLNLEILNNYEGDKRALLFTLSFEAIRFALTIRPNLVYIATFGDDEFEYTKEIINFENTGKYSFSPVLNDDMKVKINNGTDLIGDEKIENISELVFSEVCNKDKYSLYSIANDDMSLKIKLK